jgi:predicted O-methyltransferase YrrM
MIETTREVRHWHGVLTDTDDMASEAASVDLCSMLVRYLEPTTVVEAGTYRGHLTLAVANILRQIAPHGVIHSADPMDFFSHTLKQVPELQPHIKFYHGDYLTMLHTITEPIDLAYIDASDKLNSHLRWEHAMATMIRMRRGGLVLVDDTEGDWEDAKAFKNLSRTGGIHLSNHRGLTILQRAYA